MGTIDNNFKEVKLLGKKRKFIRDCANPRIDLLVMERNTGDIHTIEGNPDKCPVVPDVDNTTYIPLVSVYIESLEEIEKL